jgi:cyclic-di-GMP-binding protein
MGCVNLMEELQVRPMTETFDPILMLRSLGLPEPDATVLNFCGGARAAKVAQWVDGLKATQVSQTGVALYTAMPEVLRLKTDPLVKYEILELLRPAVQQCISGLALIYLHQPVTLSESAQKTAIVAQALEKHLIDGYTQVALELASANKANNYGRHVFICALHRALTSLGLLFCRSFQLYTQVPKGLWRHLHTLFRTACAYDLGDLTANDPILGPPLLSVNEAYLRVLAAGVARLNQVAPMEAMRVFQALGGWVGLIRLEPMIADDANVAFWLNLDADRPPLGRDRYLKTQGGDVRSLDFGRLLAQLQRQASIQADSDRNGRTEELPISLVNHLLQAWQGETHRDMDRRGTAVMAKVAVGLFECHYQLAGERTFSEFMQEPDDIEEVEVALPSFANLSGKTEKRDQVQGGLGQVFDVQVINQSSGGYCLQWQSDTEARLEAGDLIAIREQGRRSWNLCMVRWLRRLKDGPQVGLKRLANNPLPLAISARLDDGDFCPFMRGFWLSGPQQGTGKSVLAPSLPFQAGQTVRIKSDGHFNTGRLDQCSGGSAKVRQFNVSVQAADS